MDVASQGHPPQKKRVRWDEIKQKAQELDALGVPRTLIAEQLGMHRVTLNRNLGPKRVIVNRDPGDEESAA